MIVNRPRGDDLETGMDVPRLIGFTDGIALPFNLLEDEQEKLLAEHREALRRRRPCGFQAVWPDDAIAAADA